MKKPSLVIKPFNWVKYLYSLIFTKKDKMICLIALVVFGFLGIFSFRYRVIAKEALDCVFRRFTLRKCESGLDRRLKNQITSNVGKKHPKTAKFLFKYFEVFSWIMVLLLVWSLFEVGVGVYNYVNYGSCIKPGDDGVCFLNPIESYTQSSNVRGTYPDNVVWPSAGNSPFIGDGVEVIMFGCYTCPYTIRAENEIWDIIERNEVRFVFKDFPVLHHRNALEYAKKAYCANKQDLYFEARSLLFSQTGDLENHLDLDEQAYFECLENEDTEIRVLDVFNEGINAHVRGTPTFFIEGEVISGSRNQDLERLERMIIDAQT